MVLVLTLLFPVVLLALLLAMEWVERSLANDAGEQLEVFLETARPDEVETFVRDGFAAALDRYWSRRRGTGARSRPPA